MKGGVMRDGRVRLRTGLRVSPAKMAMYSKPLSAPNIILVKTLRLNMVIGGITRRRGWYSESVPRQRLSGGVAMSTHRTIRGAIPPMLPSHLPKFSPGAERNISPAMRAKEREMMSHWLDAVHAAGRPNA